MKLWRIFISLVLGVLFLLPTEFIHAIIIIPSFVAHYEIHEQENDQVDVLNYVLDHISPKHQEKKGKDNHHDHTPFQHHHGNNLSLSMIHLPEMAYELKFKWIEIHQQVLPISYDEKRTSFYVNGIWQPPKIG